MHSSTLYRITLLLLLTQFILFTAQSQHFVWGKAYGGSTESSLALGRSIAVGANDDVFVCGLFYEEVNFGGTTYKGNSSEGFLLKFDSSGTMLWSKKIESSKVASFNSIKTDNDGNLYGVGYFRDSLYLEGDTIVGGERENGMLAKFSKDGEVLWIKTFNRRILHEMEIDQDGNLYVLAKQFNTIPTNLWTSSWLMKFDPAGKEFFNQRICRDDGQGLFQETRLAVDPWGNIFVAGMASKGVLFTNIPDREHNGGFVLLKYNPQGKAKWIKTIQKVDPADGAYYQCEVICDGLGNVYYSVLGDELSLSKHDPEGNTIWSRRNSAIKLGISRLALDESGNLYAAGLFYSQFTLDGAHFKGGYRPLFVAQFNSDGQLQWHLQGEKDEFSHLSSIDRSRHTGNLYATGIIYSRAPSFGNVDLGTPPYLNHVVVFKIGGTGFKPLTLDLGADTTLCPGESLELKVEGFSWQEWQDGSRSSTFYVDKPGEYQVTAVDFSGRRHYDTIRVEECFEATIPNIITPNGDAHNEYFIIERLNLDLDNTLNIYNRWEKKSTPAALTKITGMGTA